MIAIFERCRDPLKQPIGEFDLVPQEKCAG
jgi:hypothetical protein